MPTDMSLAGEGEGGELKRLGFPFRKMLASGGEGGKGSYTFS